MSEPQERRKRAKRDAEQRGKQDERDEQIEGKRQAASGKAPDPEDVNGPRWNAAALLYLQALDQRMERIEDELGIEQ